MCSLDLMAASRRSMIIAMAVLLVGCSSREAVRPQPTPSPSASPGEIASPDVSPSSAGPSPPVPSPSPSIAASHVFVIVMENKSMAQALGPSAPYTNSLVQRYALATNYQAISHPSLPNYLALTSGSTWGIADDGYHTLPAQRDLGGQLTAAGISWRAYMESMTGGCFHSASPYALKHNPFAYYGGACPANVVSIAGLGADLAGSTPRFVWITPNLCNDTHDCPVATGDRWLAQVVPEILGSAAWKDGGVLFITWDEANAGTNQVAALVIAPHLKAHSSSRAYTHYSLLATIEDGLGVQRLGQAATATPMDDLL
jgi:phospholipase C